MQQRLAAERAHAVGFQHILGTVRTNDVIRGANASGAVVPSILCVLVERYCADGANRRGFKGRANGTHNVHKTVSGDGSSGSGSGGGAGWPRRSIGAGCFVTPSNALDGGRGQGVAMCQPMLSSQDDTLMYPSCPRRAAPL